MEKDVIDILDDPMVEGTTMTEEDYELGSAEIPNYIPANIRRQVEVQTPKGTPVGDIVLTSNERGLDELRSLTKDLEKDLQEIITNSCKKDKKVETNKKKGPLRDKKRRREDEGEEEDTEDDEEISVQDGEKVFTKLRTGKAHYLEIIKEMSYIEGIPPALLFPRMTEWVLACEIKRDKSKNINGILAMPPPPQMREHLIKLYCSIREIQSQKENTEAEQLRKQMEDMRKNMKNLQEENKNLKKELEIVKMEIIKSKIISPAATESPRSMGSTSITFNKTKDHAKDKRKNSNSGGKNTSGKRNSQPVITPIERRNKNSKIRRELSYPMDVRNNIRLEEKDLRTPENNGNPKKKGTEASGKSNKKGKNFEKASNARKNETRNKEVGKSLGKQKNLTELWSKVVGRKEKRQSEKEIIPNWKGQRKA